MAPNGPSVARLNAFKACANRSKDPILKRVTYDGKMNNVQLNAFISQMEAAEQHMDENIGNELMRHAAKLICRWPRPSELGRWAAKKGLKLKLYRTVVNLECPGMSDAKAKKAASFLVGKYKNGEFVPAHDKLSHTFASLTSKHGLLYLWMHQPKDMCRAVYICGVDEEGVSAAYEEIVELATAQKFVVSKRSSRVSELNSKAKDWVSPALIA